jgi:uncharacterized membrane protein
MATGLQTDRRARLADFLPALFTLVVGIIFGGSMVFLTPPFDVPEEGQHFCRSFGLSQGVVYASRNGDSVGCDLPASIEEVNQAIIGRPRDEHELRISIEKVKDVLRIPLEPQRQRFCEFPVTARYSPAPYLPAAAAIWVGQRAGMTALQALYIGRCGTLVGYLLLVVAAVWLTPIQKWTMTLVALMPMSIFLAGAITADALSIALALLAIAMLLRLILRAENVDRLSLLWLAAVLLLLGLAKPGYVLIALLFSLVPKSKFAGRWRCGWTRAWMIGLPIAASILWVLSARRLCVPIRPCVDVAGQAHWIFANPWTFIKMADWKIGDPYLYVGIIGMLGWGTILMAPVVYKIYWVGLMATAVLDGGEDEVRLPVFARLVSFELYFLVMAVITTITYLAWHAVGDRTIHGVQSRYCVPILPLLLLPLRSSAKVASSRLSRRCAAVLAVVVVLIGMGAAWQALVARFYWH